MKILIKGLFFALVMATSVFSIAAGAEPSGAMDVKFDRAEAEAALAIFEKQAAGKEVTDADWEKLFATTGYQRLKARETGMGRSFTEAEFKDFMNTPRTPAQIKALRRTLEAWSSQSIDVPARAALAYLPADARLKATVFPMIKPKPNEFVFDLKGDPAIFLYLDPEVSEGKARNTMAHELHHVGLNSVCPRPFDGKDDPIPVATVRAWVLSFNEGFAMVAAAGGPHIHPHADRTAKERKEWDANLAQYDKQFAELNALFLSILDGKAGDETALKQKLMGYFGVQGPWYTVGWKMASTIETQLGKKRVIDAFCDSADLLAAYNQAAALQNEAGGERLPLWDSRLVNSLVR